MQDLTLIPLHEVLIANGYTLDRSKSSKMYPCVVNPNTNERFIVSKRGENYLYFNPNEQSDRGNIISFCRIHALDIKQLVKNYDENIEMAKSYTHDFFKAQTDPNLILKTYDSLEKVNKENMGQCLIFKQRGFDMDYIGQIENTLRKDEKNNIVIPNYKLADKEFGDIYKDKLFFLSGYTKRLNYPITKDRNGQELERPIKSIQSGAKGLEIINVNKDPKTISHIVISESIIDSLSLGQLKGLDPKKTMFVSTAGNFNAQNLEKTLFAILDKANNARIILAFDNDEKGIAFSEQIESKILKHTKKFPTTYKPFAKDCNDDLKITNITGLKNLNENTYQDWVYSKMLKYKITKDTSTRATLLHHFRKLNSLKPFNEENIQVFNNTRKHAAIKGL
ncbi:toprim domain-containing protein [uncultured Helicobacter sp.]|uniref:toprim domain-containing protein n=1 Tax=uncultured Helicobacter sp. TaxID=175537 RepID=UPI003752A42E